jgi:ferritin
MEDADIDKFLQNFDLEQKPTTNQKQDQPKIDPENLEEYITGKLDEIAQLSIESIEEVKDIAIQSNDGETISALASLITAASKQLELMSKFAMQKNKIKNAESMQAKDHALKEKLLERKHEQQKELLGNSNPGGGMHMQQNNFYINASREEIMQQLTSSINSKVEKQPLTIDLPED